MALNPATDYMFLDIFTEMRDRTKPSTLRGISCQIKVEKKCDRAELHDEENAESWDARFRMHLNTRRKPCPSATVQIMVNVNMTERESHWPPGQIYIPFYFHCCSHGWIHDLNDAPTGEQVKRDGVEKAKIEILKSVNRLLHTIQSDFLEQFSPAKPKFC